MSLNDFLKGNEKIEAAITTFKADDSQKNLIGVLENIRLRINAHGHFLIPVTIPEDTMKIIEEKRAPDGKSMEINEGLHFSIRHLSTNDGRTVFAVFTSQAEAEKGDKSSMISDRMGKFLMTALDTEAIDGVVLNPWGESFFLSKDTIKKIFDVDEQIKQKLREGVQNFQ